MASTFTIQIVMNGQDNASNAIKTVNKHLDNMQKELGETKKTGLQGAIDGVGTRMQGFVRNLGGMVAAMGIAGVGRFLGEMNQLGIAVGQAEVMFNTLTANIGGSLANIEALRGATGNVVDDFTLMNGANSLLQMGIASNTDELARFIDIAVSLKRPTVDAATAIDDFGKLLANQSILRLDNFGISAVQVRQRIDELIASGQAMGRADAFPTAVLDIAGRKLLDLGPAADVAVTAFGRMQAEIDNTKNNFAELIAQMGEFIARTGEVASQMDLLGFLTGSGGGIGGIVDRTVAEQAPREAFTNIQSGAMDNLLRLRMRGGGAFNPNDMLSELTDGMFSDMSQLHGPEIQILNEMVARARQQEAEMFRAFASSVPGAGGIMGQQPAFQRGMDPRMIDLFHPSGDKFTAGRMGEFMNIHDLEQMFIQQRGLGPQIQQGRISSFIPQLSGEMIPALVNMMSGAMDARRSHVVNRELGGIGVGAQGVSSTIADFGGLQSVGGETIFNPAGLGAVQQHLSSLEPHLERMQMLHDAGFISDAALEKAQQMTDNARQLADQAQRGADAFNNMSLDQLLGETGGGRLGELSDMVIGTIQDSLEGQEGADSTVSDIQSAFDLASGRETELSKAFEEQFAPLLGTLAQQDTDAAITAMNAALAAVESGQLMGLSDADIIAMVQQAIGFRMGDDGTAVAMETKALPPTAFAEAAGFGGGEGEGASPGEAMSTMAADASTMSLSLMEAKEALLTMDLTKMQASFAGPHSQVAEMSAMISNMTNGDHIVNLTVQTSMDALGQQIIANGGVVPGANNQVNPNANASFIP